MQTACLKNDSYFSSRAPTITCQASDFDINMDRSKEATAACSKK